MSALKIFLEVGGEEDFSVIAIGESTGALADCDIILEGKVRRNAYLKRHCEFIFCVYAKTPILFCVWIQGCYIGIGTTFVRVRLRPRLMAG
jgi:hypothetical protein